MDEENLETGWVNNYCIAEAVPDEILIKTLSEEYDNICVEDMTLADQN